MDEVTARLLEGVKSNGKIPWDTEDDLIVLMINAARETLEMAGIPRDTINGQYHELYVLAVQRLAMHYYTQREETGSGQQTVPMGLSWMIEHLRLSDDD